MAVRPELELERWWTRRLDLGDEHLVQDLFERCLDHFELHEHGRPGRSAARDELTQVPPGRTLDDHHVHGISDPDDPTHLIGVIESVSGHPDPGTWYLGLLLVDPRHRGDGVGSAVLAAFERMVSAAGYRRIRLAVVDDNIAGRRFWERHGFGVVTTREGHELGEATHRVHVLDKDLAAAPADDRFPPDA